MHTSSIRAMLIFWLLLGPTASGLADEPPASMPADARFPTGTIAFPTGRLGFEVGRTAFPTARIDFPTRKLVATSEGAKKGETRFELATDVLFDFDKAELRPEASGVLRGLAAEIKAKLKQPVLRIEGHTDAKGEDAYNRRLSERRAEAVRAWLLTHAPTLGVKSIATAGAGETRPVAPNTAPDGQDDPVGRQRNRRVEIVGRNG